MYIADLQGYATIRTDTMSRQFRVYIVPPDIQSILDQLRSKVGLRVIEETAPSSKPIEVDSPVRRRSLWIKERDYVSVRCYLVPDSSADIKMRYVPQQFHWIVHSEGVEGLNSQAVVTTEKPCSRGGSTSRTIC